MAGRGKQVQSGAAKHGEGQNAQCSAGQHSEVQSNSMQSSTLQLIAAQHNAVQCGMV